MEELIVSLGGGLALRARVEPMQGSTNAMTGKRKAANELELVFTVYGSDPMKGAIVDAAQASALLTMSASPYKTDR